ncbi:MAG: phenylacetate--CoA ligase [Coriobacteriia bacterium]|nr:phenylacetate--CoA ligase [Coriobacteriia bacterium]
MYRPEIESAPREAIEKLQLERLQSMLIRVYDNVGMYRKRFDEAGFDPRSVQSLEDLSHAPFTTKDDLRNAYPYGLFAVPLKDIVRIHSSSGTTGQITVGGYTRHDLEVWAELVARVLTAAGATADSIVQVAYGYGLFTGGLGVHDGSQLLGAMTVPASGGNTKRQVKMLKDLGVNLLACTPSYALRIAETMQEMGVDADEMALHGGVFGAEPWSEQMRTQIENGLGIRATDIYGLSEVMGPGVAGECECQSGLHVFEDHFLLEVVDTETLKPVPDNQYGEVVFTTLTKEGIPLVRYRTRDISRIILGECACGRTLRRMERITGRSDDMLIIRGVNVYPSQIEQVLLGIPGIAPHYQVVLSKKGSMDHIEAQVEVAPGFSFDEVSKLEMLKRQVGIELASSLSVSISVKLVEPKSITRSEGKAKRVVDLRVKEEGAAGQ